MPTPDGFGDVARANMTLKPNNGPPLAAGVVQDSVTDTLVIPTGPTGATVFGT